MRMFIATFFAVFRRVFNLEIFILQGSPKNNAPPGLRIRQSRGAAQIAAGGSGLVCCMSDRPKDIIGIKLLQTFTSPPLVSDDGRRARIVTSEKSPLHNRFPLVIYLKR